MRKKLQSTISSWISPIAVVIVLIIWQVVSASGLIPKFMLPSPFEIIKAFSDDFTLVMSHAKVTLIEAFIGLCGGVLIGFILAVTMERFAIVYKICYPLIILTQTVPTVAIAPLLVLWFGYGMLPKIILITIVTFFPVAVGLLNGFQSVDKDGVRLLQAMGGTHTQIFRVIKFPSSLGAFFAGVRIAASYAVVGAVISEWLGGFWGLGVYMTRVRKAYAFDKMFAVIFLVSAISLGVMALVDILQRRCMPWEEKKDENKM